MELHKLTWWYLFSKERRCSLTFDRQEYVVVICLDDTQLLPTILYACVARQYVAVKIIERLNLLIQVHSRTYTFAMFSLLSNSLWLLRSCFRSSYSPHHRMIQLDFNVLVEAIDLFPSLIKEPKIISKPHLHQQTENLTGELYPSLVIEACLGV